MKRLYCSTAIIGFALLAPMARAQAPWPIVYDSKGVTVALDIDGAERNSDGSWITRTRWDYDAARRLESKRPYTQMTEVALVRCSPVRVKRLTESFYAEGGAVVREGSMPNPGEVQYMTWDRIKTGTDGSRAYASMCALLKKRDRGR